MKVMTLLVSFSYEKSHNMFGASRVGIKIFKNPLVCLASLALTPPCAALPFSASRPLSVHQPLDQFSRGLHCLRNYPMQGSQPPIHITKIDR